MAAWPACASTAKSFRIGSESRVPEIDLASIVNGARILQSSDEFFSAPLNLLMPGLGKNMGDGWETRRRRGPGHDWTIVKLGVPGSIRRVEVDTVALQRKFPGKLLARSLLFA